MAALSRLAGAVAHDYHALLSQILGSSEVAQQLLPLGHPAGDCITRIQTAGQEAAALTARLLAFDPNHPCTGAEVNVDARLRSLHTRWQQQWGVQLPVALHLEAGDAIVRADAALFDRALTDLVLLAEEAPIAGTGPTVRTAVVGTMIELTITLPLRFQADTVLDLVLNGLSTGEAARRSRALGLAAADHLVRRWCGALTLTTGREGGSTVTMVVPQHCGESMPPVRPGTTTVRRRAACTILVAEDDPGVRSLIVSFLRLQGYLVLEAEDGEQALALAREHTFDLLLADVVLPKRPGPVLADVLRRGRADLPVILMSGFLDDADLIAGLGTGGREFLQKPFAPHALVKMIERMLHPMKVV